MSIVARGDLPVVLAEFPSRVCDHGYSIPRTAHGVSHPSDPVRSVIATDCRMGTALRIVPWRVAGARQTARTATVAGDLTPDGAHVGGDQLAACGAPPTTRAGRGPAHAGLNECPTSPRSRPGRWPTKFSGHQTESSVRMAPRDAAREISAEQIHVDVGVGARRGAGCRGRRHDRGTGDGPGLRRRCRTSLRSSRDGARSRRSTRSGSWDRAAAQQQSKCRAFGSFDRARAAAPCLTP